MECSPSGTYAAFSAGRCTLSLSGPYLGSPFLKKYISVCNTEGVYRVIKMRYIVLTITAGNSIPSGSSSELVSHK